MPNKSKQSSISEGLDRLFKPTAAQPLSEKMLPVTALQTGHYQTRIIEPDVALHELADSIKQHGIIQPILVRQLDGAANYEVIAGHRRWEAAKLAGLNMVPVQVKDVDEQTVAAFTVIENIQRENLNPIEEAHAYQKLIDEFTLTHDDVAKRVGRPRASISNFLRLLRLARPIQQWLVEKRLDMGHAKVLLSLDRDQQLAAGQLIVQRQLSVRQTETLVRQLQQGKPNQPPVNQAVLDKIDALTIAFEQYFNKPIDIKLKGRIGERGKLSLEFHSLDELEQLLKRLGGNEH